MIPVKRLVQELEKLPEDALAYAYEGEIIGIVIATPDGKELGYIPTSESEQKDFSFVDSRASD